MAFKRGRRIVLGAPDSFEGRKKIRMTLHNLISGKKVVFTFLGYNMSESWRDRVILCLG